ncbi:MAG: GspH/FimT family pseudopilin [Gammaproteobacteria bacterium]|nr:GspH/FimT family pseudopilin [Gammaproteobacteria bacterium]
MHAQRGISLVELSLVVAILGVIAVIVLPNYAATGEQQLELASHRVADALRFARSEAIRSGALRGVLVDTADDQALGRDITVFEPDLATAPFGLSTLLRDPLSRQPYDAWLGGSVGGGIVGFADGVKPFAFDGVSGNQSYVFFDADGFPRWVDNGVLYRMTDGAVRLAAGHASATVVVDPADGTVRIQ